MADIISWPIGPVEGDQYSVNGKFWEFNGCAWIATCCPGVCSIYDNGIILGITQDLPWGLSGAKTSITTKICFTYDAQTETWNSESLNDKGDYYQMIEDEPGTWLINYMALGVVKSNLGDLAAVEPIGEWKWNDKDQKAETICGCPPIICGCAQSTIDGPCENFTFFPVSFTGVSGDTTGYISTESGNYIYYDTVNSLWKLSKIGDTISYYSISFPITTIPIGSWASSPSEFANKYPYFSTTLGHCNPCNVYTDGIILAYTANGLVTYVPLTWNSILGRFENFDGTIYIRFNGVEGQWNLWINGQLKASHKGDLLGFWDKLVTILCGSVSITNTEGCLIAVQGEESTVTLYLQENTAGDFNYGYPFSQPTWQIVCEEGTWDIQQWSTITNTWVTQATTAASCDTPPYALTWAVDPGSDYDSFSFTEGPCPIVCNSYTFRSDSQDGSQISFKLCGCDQRFIIDAYSFEDSDIYCVQEDSIDLGAFGVANPVLTPCIPNESQCYTIIVSNKSLIEASLTYINCDGNSVTVIVPVFGRSTICGIACSIQVNSGRFEMFIKGLGCLE
jgi:hypothetical protein